LLANGAGVTINPSVYLKLPYDPERDFQPITQVTSGAYFMVISPSLPAKTVKEYIALAKAKPGSLNFAATGTNNLLAAEQFNYMAGIKTVAVNYKGTGQAVSAVLSGEVQSFIVSPLIAVPQVKGGKLRAIGVTGLKRSPALPDVPTIAETLPGYENITWHSVLVPAKTPRPIVAKLSKELMKIIRQPDVHERFTSVGLDPVGSTPEELAALMERPGPGPHLVTLAIAGTRVRTLADLPPMRDRLLFVGLNPSPVSVDAGHYHQGKLGRTFW